MFIERRNREDSLYAHLQKRSLEMMQELSGEIWTDFNPHDPGITISDHFNYALLELNHLCELPFQDYFKNTQGNLPLDYEKIGLFTSKEIFEPSVVTCSDYEELLMETFEDVITCQVLFDSNLYHFSIEVSEQTDKEKLQQDIELLFHANRNLCENLGMIEFRRIEHAHRFSEKIDIPVYNWEEVKPLLSYIGKPVYTSIQNDFPDCYGVNPNGMSTGSSLEHQAQVRQLKGFLLIFDHLLAHAVQQVTDTPRLLEYSNRIPSVEKIPSVEIPEIDKLT